MSAKEFEKVFKALANYRRILMVRYLCGVNEASVGRIAFEIAISLNATSRHLAILERAGFLDREQRNLEVFYRIKRLPDRFIKTVLDGIS